MPVLHRPDVSLHYESDGDGPPLILIAGMTSDAASWGPLVVPLEKRFTVIRPDNRTTGQTTPPDAPVSFGHWVADIAALIAHLDNGPAHVVGHSLGGAIGIALAARHPETVSKLALLAAAPVQSARNLHLFETLLRLRDPHQPPDLWLRAFFPWLFHPEFFDDPAAVDQAIALSLAYPHAQNAAQMRRQIAAAWDRRLASRHRDITCPTLAILAADDLILPPSMATRQLAQIPGIAVKTVSDAGHSIHWDQPQAVLDLLIPFLEATS